MMEGSGAGFVLVTKTDPDGDPGAQKHMDLYTDADPQY